MFTKQEKKQKKKTKKEKNTTAEKEKKTRPGMNAEKHNCRKRKKQDQE
jgi:hypothetical protein